MTVLWDKRELLAAVNGFAIGPLPEAFSGVSIDSRTLAKGDIFFCIKGNRFDGHDFATKAHTQGAGAIVIAREHLPEMKKLALPLVVVPDVLQALENLAQAARKRSKAKIIAITGSVGKTTTKEILKQALETVGKVHANLASLNNCWGVPLTLARMSADSDYGIFEIGMNHKDEIRPLVKLVRPHVALITCIAAVHMGFFKNLEEISDAKAEIFEGLDEDGTAILNADDDFFSHLVHKAKRCGVKKILSFGKKQHADYRAKELFLSKDSSHFVACVSDRDVTIKICAPGKHIAQNSLGVFAVCGAINADLTRIIPALSQFSLQEGRGICYRLSLPSGGVFHLIDESYNANPASMRAALDLLAAGPVGEKGRRIAVLGDMLELGAYSERLHRDLVEPVCASGADPVFLFGKEMGFLAADLSAHVRTRYAENIKEILSLIFSEISDGDLIMVKSSRSIYSSNIVVALLDRYKVASQ
ncbi:UDP-N-acetylmuramoyl-tripeptide--D-alanyl-D-alanine ligase [Bartonella sp. CB178]|uniref:UDP-N-acetylmuramoyl-tripeptide--D-alanyl-D- alanine ligase n=1 Tax=Bartonella sp. CB178 TaxID=3112255 RepID=UPI00300DE511